jgi:hypothetical protein
MITEREHLASVNYQTIINIRHLMSMLMVYGLVDDEHLFSDVKSIHDSLERMAEHYSKHAPQIKEQAA